MASTTRIVQDIEGLSALTNPVRIKMLRLMNEPCSASRAAAVLGIPRQQANYHLRELERAGLIEFVTERKRGNCMERLYRGLGSAYALSSSILGDLRATPERVVDRASTDYLVAIGAKLIDDAAVLSPSDTAPSSTRPAPSLAIEAEVGFESEATLGKFSRELADALAQLIAKYHSGAGALPCRIVFVAHPTVPDLPQTEL